MIGGIWLGEIILCGLPKMKRHSWGLMAATLGVEKNPMGEGDKRTCGPDWTV